MHRITCGNYCSYLWVWCVKNLTQTTARLCFLPLSVFFKCFLTQFLAFLNTVKVIVLTSLAGGLYTLSTALITNTKYLNIFINYCWI